MTGIYKNTTTNFTVIFVCIFLQFLFFVPDGFCEGTKELMPDEANPTRILLDPSSGRVPFALYSSRNDSNYRLCIRIVNPATERIYFGLGQQRNTNNQEIQTRINWRIHPPNQPSQVQCTGLTPLVNNPPGTPSDQGFIASYAQAFAGPNNIDPAGYDPLVCVPTNGPGDYFMTFEATATRTFDFLDITVVNIATVPPTVIPGRVFSRCWQIRNPSFGFNDFYTFHGNLFIYSNDGIVTKLNPNGMEGRDFAVSCNESGCYQISPTWNAQQARQSQPGPNPRTYPQYRIFVNNPDPTVYPDGVIGQLVSGSVSTQTFCNTGTVNFTFQTTPVNAVGTVEITLTLSSLSPPLIDRILVINNVPGGWYTVTWDGLDGGGTQVPSGSTFPFTLRYTNGLTHMPLWDVEQNVNGFLVNLVRPILSPPLADPAFYWDDTKTGVGGGSMINPPGCTVPPATSCHAWGVPPYNGDWGNNKTINTWWYLVSNSTASVNLTYKKGPDTLVALAPGTGATVCPGNTLTFTVANDPNSQQYKWVWNGGNQTTTLPTINITFPNNAPPGVDSVAVNGVNTDCGNGDTTYIRYTVLPFPTIEIFGDAQACKNDTKIYTTQAGQYNYVWTTSGGTIISSSGNMATIQWPNAGSHAVSVNYTSTSGCTPLNPTSKTVVVHDPPVPVIAGPQVACAGQTQVQYSTAGGKLNYVWTVSSGGTITSGAGTNAIEVTWSTAGNQNVSVLYTETSTGCTAAAPVTYPVTVNALPIPTLTATPATNPCVGSSSNIYSTEAGMSGYSWLVSPGGMITSGGTASSNTVTVTWNTVGPQNVTVNYTDGNQCRATDNTTLPVTVSPLPVIQFTGSSTACVNNPGPEYIAEAGNTGYAWALVPASAGTITSGTGTNIIQVTWTTVGNHQVSLNYTSGLTGCTATNPTTFPVTVNTLPVPMITGEADPCTYVPETYITQTGATSYLWEVSPGGTIVAGGDPASPTVTVNWTVPGAQTVRVNYTVGTGCTGASPTQYDVDVHQSTPPEINGDAEVCQNEEITYTTQAGNSNYQWSVSDGGTFITGTAGNSVTVRWITAGVRTLSVNFTNNYGCTAPIPTVKTIIVNPLPSTTITMASNPVCNGGTNTFQTFSDPQVTFTWSMVPPERGSVISGQGSNVVICSWNSAGSAVLNVSGINNTTGCSSSSSTNIIVNPSPEPVFTPCFDVKTTSLAKKFNLRGASPFVTGSGSFSGTRVSLNSVTGLYEFDPFGAGVGTYQVTYTFQNVYQCSATSTPVQINVFNNSFSCGNELTDIRDGNKYKTAQIGGRCWMQENLRYGTAVADPSTSQTDNCISEKYCLTSDPTCAQYGGLYQWDELMAYQSTSQNQGLCPPEWHVPSESEWQQMINLISAGTTPPADGIAGGFLRDPILNPGFRAVLKGLYYLNHQWSFIGGILTSTMYWTSTPSGIDDAIARGVNNINPSVSKYPANRGNAFSVRCVRD